MHARSRSESARRLGGLSTEREAPWNRQHDRTRRRDRLDGTRPLQSLNRTDSKRFLTEEPAMSRLVFVGVAGAKRSVPRDSQTFATRARFALPWPPVVALLQVRNREGADPFHVLTAAGSAQ